MFKPTDWAAGLFCGAVATAIVLAVTAPASSQTVSPLSADQLHDVTVLPCMACMTEPGPATRDQVETARNAGQTANERVFTLNAKHNATIAAVNAHDGRIDRLESDLDPIQQRIADAERANAERLQALQAQRADSQAMANQVDAVQVDVEGLANAQAAMDRRIEDVAALAGVADSQALETVRADIGRLDSKIDDVDTSAKKRDAAILATPSLQFGLGDRYAVNVALGSAGGENAVGAAIGTQIPMGSASMFIQAGTGLDTGGDEMVGRASIGASW